MSNIAVIDIGKTNVKVALVDPDSGVERDVHTTPNTVLPGPPYPHFDTEAQWRFILRALTDLAAAHPIAAISITTHGATAALVNAAGDLALPILDYEHDGIEETRADYEAVRPPFSETGTPRLSMGLNLGAQIFWQMSRFPGAQDTRLILTYPQYWGFRLTGVAAVEATSLGCHTDLWQPYGGRFSTMVNGLGWTDLFPPVRKAEDVLGPILPQIARATGLAPDTPVHCGIHDSNASLYPHLLRERPPFAVVSTGTWVVAMAVGGAEPALDQARDTLVNVDALGRPVPSARFMGGREYELVRQGKTLTHDQADRDRVLARHLMLLPAVEPGSGPYQGRKARWTEDPGTLGERAVALSVYLAMMTETCLTMIGARGPVLVEGPFARNALYLEALECATGRPVHAAQGSVTGTSIGAALLAKPMEGGGMEPEGEARPTPDPALAAHLRRWRETVATDGGEMPAQVTAAH